MDDLGVSTELDKLYNVFSADYGYECEDIFEIPESGSQVALMTRLQSLIERASRDHLLIIYYGGHSDDSSSQQSIWRSHNNRSASNVNWSLNQAFLLQCLADVLIILDTCYAAKGGSNNAGPTNGANEVIAATNEVIEAPSVSRLSFTRVLVRVLKNFAEKHRTENLQLSAVWLCTHMRNYYYDQELEKPPYYVSLVNYRFESCRIVPQRQSQNRFLGEPSSLMTPDLGPFRVMVAIYLKETPSGDLVSWLQGQGAPAGYIDGVELVKIQAAHLANSSMLLVTLPSAVWLLLPAEIPCTFVGMIRSGNLLNQEKRLATANVGTEKTSSGSIEQILILDPPPTYVEQAIIMSRFEFDLQQRRQNKYSIDGVSGNVRYRPSPERYDYRHLAHKEIRLIELLPGQETDRLIGRLITVDATSAPQYVALSYVWDPPSEEGQDPQSILLDDIAIELRPNLDSAMRALRRLDQGIHIWIDVLCVNQHDVKEKAIQLPLMAKIYRLSDSVAIWLGDTTPYGKVAFSFATWITKHPDLVVHVAEEHLKVLITAFFDMIKNPWFRTQWVVADTVLAKTVNLHYGKNVLPWKIMAGAVYVLRSRAMDLFQLFLHKNNNADGFIDFLADFRYQGVNAFVDLRDDMQRELSHPVQMTPRIGLDALVTNTALLHAGMPHDSVYMMIFLASEIMPVSSNVRKKGRVEVSHWLKIFPNSYSLPRVDYDLSAQEVCSAFVRYAISSTRQLDIICRPWAPGLSNLPSWIRPRSEHAFRVLDDNRYCRVNADSLAVSTSTDQTLYTASGKGFLLEAARAVIILLNRESRSLTVKGFELGIVDVTGPPAMNGVLPKEWRKIGERSNNKLSKVRRKTGRRNIREASENWFWRTLVADRSSTGSACPPWYNLASEHVLENSDELDLDTRRLMFESPPGIVFDFLNRVQSVIWGRRLAVLDQGYLVMGPRACELGDRVCILYGCSVPVILRQIGDGENYIFIGECYVHGMMDGEAIMLKEQQDLPTKHFKLV